MKLVPLSLPRSSYVPAVLVYIAVLVLVVCLCPSSVHVVATFSGTVYFITQMILNVSSEWGTA